MTCPRRALGASRGVADDVEIARNVIERPEKRSTPSDFGIAISGCSVATVADNTINDVGSAHGDGAGIWSSREFDVLNITGNTVRQMRTGEQPTEWAAVHVGMPANTDNLKETQKLWVVPSAEFFKVDESIGC